ncbi:MAG: hypothetical protein EOO20_21165 [Chryseobacterium sp.]|nr:MAG: hypothetical protein EOO20_21165 [Chryseobacterium sp.]
MNTTVKSRVAGPTQQVEITESNIWHDMKVASKIMNLGFGRTILFRHLRSLGYLMDDNEPYQQFIDAGLFKVVLKDVYRRNGSLLFRPTVALISNKGIEVCKKRILEHIKN